MKYSNDCLPNWRCGKVFCPNGSVPTTEHVWEGPSVAGGKDIEPRAKLSPKIESLVPSSAPPSPLSRRPARRWWKLKLIMVWNKMVLKEIENAWPWKLKISSNNWMMPGLGGGETVEETKVDMKVCRNWPWNFFRSYSYNTWNNWVHHCPLLFADPEDCFLRTFFV